MCDYFKAQTKDNTKESIYVINLKERPNRWNKISKQKELKDKESSMGIKICLLKSFFALLFSGREESKSLAIPTKKIQIKVLINKIKAQA